MSFAVYDCICFSPRLSSWNTSDATGRIFVKFDISSTFFRTSLKKIQFSSKYDTNRYSARRSMRIYGGISLNFSYYEKYFIQQL